MVSGGAISQTFGSKRKFKMSQSVTEAVVVGRQCRLLKPVRDHEGRTRFAEHPRILKEVSNLGRRMYLVEFADHATTFLFPDEVAVE
jgi:hypothetical protein